MEDTPPTFVRYSPHPITDRTYWERVGVNANARVLLDAMAEVTKSYPDLPSHPAATDFLAASRSQNRGILDHYWQHTRIVLGDLVIRRLVAGETKAASDDKLLNWLWSFITCPTWSVSAHIGGDLPLTTAPQLDLAGCEMAGDLAEILELIKPWIDAQSKTLSRSIIAEIDRRILKPFAETDSAWWYDKKQNNWMNWSGVCAGSILAACEALDAIGQPRPAARAKALDTLNTFVERAYTPAGECDEGIGYWGYGLGYACIGWSRLSEADFKQHVNVDRLRTVADYPRRVHLFDDWFYSGNDASLRGHPPMFAMFWLAGATGSAWLREWTQANLAQTKDARSPMAAFRLIDGLQLDSGKAAPMRDTPASRYLTDQQVAIVRRGKLLITCAAGNNAQNHNHNDLGHFSVWSDKQLVIPDLGAPQYKADYFGPKRYTYLAASSRGHCCPVINGTEQIAGKSAAGVVISADEEKQSFTFDLTSAYPPGAKLARWTRTLKLDGSAYQIADEFCATEAIPIEEIIWTTVEPKISGKNVAVGPISIMVDGRVEISVDSVDPQQHFLRDFKSTIYRISLKLNTTGSDPIRVAMTINAG